MRSLFLISSNIFYYLWLYFQTTVYNIKWFKVKAYIHNNGQEAQFEKVSKYSKGT